MSFENLIEKITPEERSDIYYDLSNRYVGLKGRGIMTREAVSPLMELKLLLEEKANGMEYWIKKVKRNIPITPNSNKIIERELIIKYLLEETEGNANQINEMINSVISLLKNHDPKLVEIKKSRKRIRINYDFKKKRFVNSNSNYFTIRGEMTEIKLEGITWYTFCLESKELSYLDEILTDWFPFKDVFIGGYPEFIMRNT